MAAVRSSAIPIFEVVALMLAALAVPTRAGAQATERLGILDFHVSCTETARPAFNRALALLHHMTYPQAREAFQRVSAIDPACAMAHWGVAMTLFQPLWPTRPGPAALARGWEAVQTAERLGPRTERERLFVAQASAFFRDPSSTDYWLRIARWGAAAAAAHATLPDDDELAAFHALALLATAPADTAVRARADEAAGILLGVYGRNPDHPGALHYLVHANDVTGRERQSPEVTDRYAGAAPRNPHALHMPTHIYTRTGDWPRVVSGNRLAADAALEYPAGERGEFVWDEFPHAVEYLVYGLLQQGRDDLAAAEAARLRAVPSLEPSFKTAFHLSAIPARAALERRAWAEAAALVPREPETLDWDRFAWPEAISQFARGLGAVHLGRAADAYAASLRLDALEQATRAAGETLFARNIQVLRLELAAWRAHAEGRTAASVGLMQEAASLEAATPKHAVTPGPILPADELLGDLLMEQGQPAAALAAYQRSLDQYPNRFNGLLGLARAAAATGDGTLAARSYAALLAVAPDLRRPDVAKEARGGRR